MEERVFEGGNPGVSLLNGANLEEVFMCACGC